MKKGHKVSMDLPDTYDVLLGITIEEPFPSPTVKNPNRIVIRVRWEDNSESIEDVENLY